MDSPTYANFHVQVVTYKKVYNHEIQAYILIPKTLPPGVKHPVIVKIHGGGLVSGSGIYPPWFTPYILSLALTHNAILIAPNYRLLPESSLLEMLSDVDDFWVWLRSGSFQSTLPSSITADSSRTLLYGDSAGGYLALQSALRQPGDFVRAVIAAYPMVDLEDASYNTPSEKPDDAFGIFTIPPTLLAEHLAAMDPDPAKRELVSDDQIIAARFPLMLAIAQQGRLKEFCGSDESVYPLRVLEKRRKGEMLPYLFVYHGDADEAVRVSESVKFAEGMERVFGGGWGRLHIEAGASHGFDVEATLETKWLREEIEKIEGLWLNII